MIIDPKDVPQRTTTIYPEPFKTRMVGRVKQALGNAAGLKNFGVNLVTLQPGSASALRHWHTKQDEFVYIITGEVSLITNDGTHVLSSGMMAGFPAGEENGHHLVNQSSVPAVYLEIGDRTPADEATYPDDDLQAKAGPEGWIFTHKDDSPY
jgi:uncharacterized cupin superfamily protein